MLTRSEFRITLVSVRIHLVAIVRILYYACMMRRREIKISRAVGIFAGLATLAIVAGFVSAYRTDHPPADIPDNVDTVKPATGFSSTKDKPTPATPPVIPAPKPTDIAYPASLIDMTRWKITIPVDNDGNGTADEIKYPALKTYTSEHFHLNDAKNAVIFKAGASGATTKGSRYPRSELREMNQDGSEASWSSFRGTHIMTLVTSATHLPDVKSEMVLAQIHDEEDDIVMVRLEKNNLFVEADGDEIGSLETNYKLGTKFTVVIEVHDGHIKVFYNGIQKVDYAKQGTGFYFKAGCYTQTNTTKGDSAGSYGEATIYSVSVNHT